MSPSPFVPFDTQYSAHTDVTMHPITGVLTITVAFHPNNQGGYNCKIWELHPPYTGQPTMVRDYVQGKASVGPFGHGASIALPTGGVLTVVPVGADSSQVRPSIAIDPALGTPYALGGGVTLFPAPLTNLAWEGRQMPMDSGVLINVPSVFGAPVASSYLIRFVVEAAAANVRVRAGTQTAPFFLTVNTQIPGVQIHTQGWTPGPDIFVSTVNGAATVWLQVLGTG